MKEEDGRRMVYCPTITSLEHGRTAFRRHALEAFNRYVSRYDLGDERIALKVAHTFEVAALCDEIARGECMPPHDVELAWLCGLLHDIGRFEQLRRWGTFSDAASCSHAALGVDILAEELARYTADDAWANIVRKAVAYHSELRLPEGLDARERLFCTITRDADKVDILRVFSESSCSAVLGIEPAGFVNGEISAGALRGFRERRCLARAERQAALDGLVGAICLVFELESPAAREALRRRGYLERLLRSPFGMEPRFASPQTQRYWDAICADLVE